MSDVFLIFILFLSLLKNRMKEDKIYLIFLTLSLINIQGAIHSTKIPNGPTGKSGPPQKVDPFFRNFSSWTELIH